MVYKITVQFSEVSPGSTGDPFLRGQTYTRDKIFFVDRHIVAAIEIVMRQFPQSSSTHAVITDVEAMEGEVIST